MLSVNFWQLYQLQNIRNWQLIFTFVFIFRSKSVILGWPRTSNLTVRGSERCAEPRITSHRRFFAREVTVTRSTSGPSVVSSTRCWSASLRSRLRHWRTLTPESRRTNITFLHELAHSLKSWSGNCSRWAFISKSCRFIILSVNAAVLFRVRSIYFKMQ